MKKLMIVALSCLSMGAMAATATKTEQVPDGSKMIEKRLDHMQKELNLTADQRSQLEAVLKDDWQRQAQLRKDTQAKINALLTPEQQKELQDARAEHHEKMKERRQDRREKRREHHDGD